MSRGFALRRVVALAGVPALVGAGLILAASPGTAAAALSIGPVWGEVRLPGEVIRESSPLLVQLNGVGAPDIVVGTMSGNVVAIDGDDGRTLWKRSALSTGSSVNSSPSAADVDSDGSPEVFVGSGIGDPANPAAAPGGLLSFEADGTPRAGFPLRVPDGIVANLAPGIHASPAIGDVDQDGRPDVVFTSLANKSIWAVTADGQVLPGFPYYTRDTNYSTPALADLDGDGVTDFVTGQDQTPAVGAPAVESQHCGSVRGMTGFATNVFAPIYRDEIVRSSPAVGDVDGDGAAEIVVGSGNYWSNPTNQNGSSRQLCPNPDPGHVLVLSASGMLERDINVGGSAFPSPALADVNGDGVADVVIGTSTQTGSGGGYVVAFDARNGQTIWKRPVRADGIEDVIGGVSAADLDGDGRQDVLVPAGSGIYIHDGASGNVVGTINSGQVSYQNTPAVTDMDGDGRLDVVVAGSRGDDGVIQRFEVGVNGSVGALSWPTFHHDARRSGNLVTPPLTLTPPAYCATAPMQGYWLATADGNVYGFCRAQQFGSAASLHLNQPIVSMASTVTGRGYWLMAADGGVFSFGDAAFYGSTGAMKLNSPVITAMPTASGGGYWLIASDGGVFSFGDAAFYGSTGAMRLNKPIVTGMATASGRGYWLIASDGGVFSFGDAAFYGSTGAMTLNRPIVTGMATPSGHGYWLIASDGGVFTFGDAAFYGSTGAISLNKPIVAAAATPSGSGYWMFASDGGVFTFGDAAFLGSLGRTGVASPVVAAATP